MRILFVSGTYPPSINGVAIVVGNLKSELQKLGHEVVILAPDNPNGEKEDGVIRYPSMANPAIKDFPIPLFPGIRSFYKLIRTFKPDIVHVHHPFHVGFFAKLIADRYNAPLIFTFHSRYDAVAEKFMKFLPKRIRKLFIDNRIYDFCRKVDLIISPSENLTDELRKKLPYAQIKTIPSPAPDLVKRQGTKDYWRKKLNLPGNKNILLSVGRLSVEKDTHLLITSLKLLPGTYILVLVGEGAYESELKKLAKKLNLEKRVIFIGKVEHKNIGKYYQAADTFFYSSTTETQGLIFLEALTFGLPIVATESSASKEWIRKDFGILTEDTPEALAKGVIELENKNLKFASQKAEEFTKNFTPVKQTRKLIRAYQDIIKKKKLTIDLQKNRLAAF